MIRAGLLVVAVALTLATAACGPSVGPGPDVPRPAAESAYPALRWVPSDAGFVVAGARVSDVIALGRELAMPVVFAAGGSFEQRAMGLRDLIGIEVLDGGEIAAAGIDLDGSIAVFGDLRAQTLIAPVADAALLATFLEARRPERDLGITQHDDREIYTWHMPGGAKLAWVVEGDWLLVHHAVSDDGGNAWLEDVLEASGIAGAPDFRAALSRSVEVLGSERGDRPALVGLVRASLAAGLATLEDDAAGCVTAVVPHLRGVAFGASVGWDFADGFVELELSPAARDRLASKLGPGAPAGLRALRDEAGVFASVTIDLGWLEQLGVDCLGTAIALDHARLAGWEPPPAAYHLAAANLDVDEPNGQLAVHLPIRDRSFVDALLDTIPMRSLFDRGDRIGGQAVRVVGVPGFPKVFYRLTGDVLSAAVGKSWMTRLLEQGDAAGDGRELVAVGVRPEFIGDLEGLLELLRGRFLPYRGSDGLAEMARLVRRYERASLDLLLDGSRLRLRGAMQLRQ